jgi:mRNA-degrading endonuclease HigB of HigAB toxin-antitoxin module
MIIFDSADIYIASKKNAYEKLEAIDQVIDALITTALKAAASGNVTEYDLDTGQTKIKTMYRSPKEVSDAITAFQGIREHYVNQINGRRFRLVDSSNFKPPYYGPYYRG